MKKNKGLRYINISMLLTVLSVLVLYFYYSFGKCRRDEIMLFELGILMFSLTFNISEIPLYLKKYNETQPILCVWVLVTLVATVVAFAYNTLLAFFLSGPAVLTIVLVVLMWLHNLFQEVRR